MEFDFLLQDSDGHIALFSTAGYGPIPLQALPEHEDDAVDVEGVAITALPVIGTPLRQSQEAHGCAEWIALAERGIFVFDWRHRGGPYDRLLAPSHPVAIESLPLSIKRHVAGTHQGCFGTTEAIADVPDAAD